MAVLNWWSHLSGSSRHCACNEKMREKQKEKEKEKGKEKEKEKEEREKQITVTAGSFWGIISNYSYRRASAGELILHYITVGPSPGIRNVIIIAAMVSISPEYVPHLENSTRSCERFTV